MTNRTIEVETHTLPFLRCLAGCTPGSGDPGGLSFQTFSDAGIKGHGDPLARVFHGSIRDLLNKLHHLNGAGAGIFTTVNTTNLKGRSKAHIQALRGWWCDLDSKHATEPFSLDRLPLAPTMAVRTPGGWHIYWLAENPAVANEGSVISHEAELSGIQAALFPFGADAMVCQVACVLRLPGFLHRKAAPPHGGVAHVRWPALLLSDHQVLLSSLSDPCPYREEPPLPGRPD